MISAASQFCIPDLKMKKKRKSPQTLFLYGFTNM